MTENSLCGVTAVYTYHQEHICFSLFHTRFHPFLTSFFSGYLGLEHDSIDTMSTVIITMLERIVCVSKQTLFCHCIYRI